MIYLSAITCHNMEINASSSAVKT